MMTNPFVKFPNQPTDNFLERLGGSTLKSPESNTTSNITWSTTGKVGWNISGTTISRTGSAGWSTSKIQSTDTFTVGDEEFMIEFSGIANDLNSTMIGFNKGTLGYYYGSGSPQNSADFSIYVAGGSRVEVYESGSKNYDSGGSRNANDKFRIEVDIDGVVKYYLQEGGTGSFDLKYTSSTTASGTYFIQANAYASTSEVTVHSKTVTIPASPSIKQHFIEWFSGKTLPSYWNKRTIAGSGSFTMTDGVDKGFNVTFSSGRGCIDFSAIRPFSKTGSKFIAVASMNSTSSQYWLLGMKYGETSYSPEGYYFNYMDSGSTFTFQSYGGGSTSTATSTSVSTSPSGTFHHWDGEVTSSNMLGKVDGVLEATRTANMPQNNMHPFFFTQYSSVAGNGNIRYMECYNT